MGLWPGAHAGQACWSRCDERYQPDVKLAQACPTACLQHTFICGIDLNVADAIRTLLTSGLSGPALTDLQQKQV